jgi:SAM-dependent methyltransferase
MLRWAEAIVIKRTVSISAARTLVSQLCSGVTACTFYSQECGGSNGELVLAAGTWQPFSAVDRSTRAARLCGSNTRLLQFVSVTCPQVLLCDNLSLPFRDESFDAVLSVAVVHHFATTERRVGALRELARVLRIGGRLIITVWAMKQRHRKVNGQ